MVCGCWRRYPSLPVPDYPHPENDERRKETDLEYIPELCTERHTGWLNISGSINKPQRIGTRYSAGVLAESAIFTYVE